MLIAEEAFDPVVSTFSNLSRSCDNGRMPSSYGSRVGSGLFAKGFLMGILKYGSDAPDVFSSGRILGLPG